MKKSLIALLLVVALVVTVSVFAVSADSTNPFEDVTSGTVIADCPYCGADQTWYPITAYSSEMKLWNGATADGGHFYSTADWVDGSGDTLTAGTWCINLNGFTTTRTTGNWFTIAGADAATAPVLNILDTSVGGTGAMDCGTVSSKEFFKATGTGTVNVYGGTIYASGSKTTDGSGNNPVLIASESTSSVVFNLYGGTLKGKSQYSDGLMKLNGSTVVNVDGAAVEGTGGTGVIGVLSANAKLYLRSGSITGASCNTTSASAKKAGQAVRVTGGGLFEMTGGTLTGNTPVYGDGGALYVSKGNAVLKGGTITGSAVKGGGIYATGTGSTVTLDGVTIKDCSAASGGGAYFAWGSTLKMSGSTKFEKNTATGSGGNLYGAGVKLQITGGEITGGESALAGGNIWLEGSAFGSITGTTISGGKAGTHGGNIACASTNSNQSDVNRAKGVVLGEGTTLSGGTATTFGGNLYISNMYTLLTLDGAVLNGTNAKADKGINIGVWNMDTLNIKGNTVIKNGGIYNSVYLGDCDDDDTTDATTFNLKVTLDGKADVDYIYFSGYPTDGYELCGLTIKEGFEGAAKLVWQADNLKADATLKKADFRKANTILPGHVTAEENYANGGTLYVLDDTSSQKAIAYFDTNADQTKELATTGMVGVDADGVEHVITAMPTDNTYAYIKLYGEGMTIELTQDVVVDVNNMDAHFVTGDNKLTVVNYRNTSTTVNANDMYFTVDKTENLVNLTVAGRNPVSKAQYIIIPEADNKYSAHQVKVDINMVSVRPKTASMYYTTTIAANAKVAPYAKSYGVILSLVDMPDANFVNDDSNQDGQIDNIRTETDLNETAAFAYETNSALLTGILTQGASTNNEYGQMKVYANAYVCVNINGTDCYIMADETADYSLKDIMEKVNEDPALAANEKVIEMYLTWSNPLEQWGLDNIAANAAKAA